MTQATAVFGTIGFSDIKVTCIIGELPEERTLPQEIIIDFRVAVDFSKCHESDDLEDAVDYTLLVHSVREVAQEGKYRLIETLVWNICNHFQMRYHVPWAWVRVRKPHAFAGLGIPMAELEVGSKP